MKQFTRRALLLLATAALLPACGKGRGGAHIGDGGGLSGGGGGGAVVLLTDTNYVDYDPSDTSSEASNLEYALLGMGFQVRSAAAAGDIPSLLSGASALVIPETETGDLAPDITPGAAAAVSSFVNGGGIVVTFQDGGDNADVLNALFGFSIVNTGSETDPYDLQAAAGGTPFEGGPAALSYADGTTALDPLTLPAGSKIIYLDQAGEAIVVMIPYGRGWVVYLGYDWYDGAPFGSQDGGWLDVLTRAMQLAGK